MLGIAVASVGMMVNDPALYPQVVTGLLGGFIADRILHWRNAEKDADEQRNVIESDLQAGTVNPEVQALFQQLNLAEVVTEAIGRKLDAVSLQVVDVKDILQQMLDAGFAKPEQIDARYSQGLVYKPVNSTINQTFVQTQIIQQAQRYTFDKLHQLRPIPDTFTGRTKEIEDILNRVRAAKDGAVTITSATATSTSTNIAGMGGVGKTELANLIAHALAPDFPGGQLLIEMSANGAAPRTAAQALAWVLQQYFPADAAIATKDEAGLQAMYINTLSNQRVLVLIDDCGSDADARKLLPPPGCIALITSRQNLATGERLRLDGLTRVESITLLRRYRASLTDAQASALAALCADLPIALSVAGSLLDVYFSLSADVVIASLQADRIGKLEFEDQSVQRVFAASYERLSPELQRIWGALSVMPADFDRAAAVAVGEFDAEAAPSPLDELVRRNLIVFDATTERFRWHDLLQEFASGGAADEGRKLAKQRHTAWFTAIGNEYEIRTFAGDLSSRTALLELDWEHMVAVAQDEPDKAPLMIQLSADSEITKSQHVDVGRDSQRLLERFQSLSEQALQITRETGNRKQEAVLVSVQADMQAEIGKRSAAVGLYEQALTIYREIGDRNSESSLHGKLGKTYAALGDQQRAVDHFEQQIVISREIGDRISEANACREAITIYRQIGRLNRAAELIEAFEAAQAYLADKARAFREWFSSIANSDQAVWPQFPHSEE